jgi:hypothetical protein
MTVESLVDATNTRGARSVFASSAPPERVSAYFDAHARRLGPYAWAAESPVVGGGPPRVARIWVSAMGDAVVIGDDPRPGEITRIVVEEWPAGHPVER